MVATAGTAIKQRMIPNMRHNIAVAKIICVDWGRKFIRTPLIRLHVTAGLQRPRDEARTVRGIAPCPVYEVTVRHSTNPLRHASLQLTQRHTSRGCPQNDQFKDSENHFLWNSSERDPFPIPLVSIPLASHAHARKVLHYTPSRLLSYIATRGNSVNSKKRVEFYRISAAYTVSDMCMRVHNNCYGHE